MARVDRCVCRGVGFEAMVRMHAAGATLEEIRARTGCGGSCGLCLPYIRVALATGQGSVPVASEEELRAMEEQARRAQ